MMVEVVFNNIWIF